MGKKYNKERYLLDIVVPVFGEWDYAVQALKSIEVGLGKFTDPYRVLLLDNGTPPFTLNTTGQRIMPAEASAEALSLLQPERGDVFHRLEQNKGYPGGLNFIVTKGKAPLILILSADIVLTDGCIEEMVREMDDSNVGVVGAKLLFPLEDSPHGRPGTVQHAGHAVQVSGDVYHIYLNWSADNPRVNVRREVQSVTGALFMTRRELWKSIGGMQEYYGAGTYEDADFCLTVRQHGKKVIYNPKAVAYHYVGGSITHGAMQGRGFDLAANAQVFKGRWANKGLAWDEWSAY